MKTSLDRPIDDRTIDRLLGLRQQISRKDTECPELEVVALVQEGLATPEQWREASDHLQRCERCGRAVAAFREVQIATLTDRAARLDRWPVGLRLWPLSVTVAVLLVVGVSLLTWRPSSMSEQSDAGTAFVIKGPSDSLAIAVERGGQRFTARSGDRLLEGDRLGFFYSASRLGYLVLLDVFQSGRTAVLYPVGSEVGARIEAGQNRPLPDGGVMREVEGAEWLVGVFSEQPLAVSELEELVRHSMVCQPGGCVLDPSIPQARTVWLFPLGAAQPQPNSPR